jgi:hypothetical protein
VKSYFVIGSLSRHNLVWVKEQHARRPFWVQMLWELHARRTHLGATDGFQRDDFMIDAFSLKLV